MNRADLKPSLDEASITPATRALFPLKLTPFEYYMYLDGQLGNSLAFVIWFEVEGNVDGAALERAVAFEWAGLPLCQARVTSGRWGAKFWSLETERRPEIVWAGDRQSPFCWPTLWDLACEPGVRLCVEQRGERATINIQFHHACCDGAGALQWIEDLLAWYAILT